MESLRDRYADLDVILSSSRPNIVGLQEVIKSDIGGDMLIDDRRFSFLYPPLADIASSTWIFDHDSEVLFTADGFGSLLDDVGESELTYDETKENITAENIRRYHEDELIWLKYVDPDKIRHHVEEILREYDPSWLAPTHGHPIPSDDIEDYLDKLSEGMTKIAAAR